MIIYLNKTGLTQISVSRIGNAATLRTPPPWTSRLHRIFELLSKLLIQCTCYTSTSCQNSLDYVLIRLLPTKTVNLDIWTPKGNGISKQYVYKHVLYLMILTVITSSQQSCRNFNKIVIFSTRSLLMIIKEKKKRVRLASLFPEVENAITIPTHGNRH